MKPRLLASVAAVCAVAFCRALASEPVNVADIKMAMDAIPWGEMVDGLQMASAVDRPNGVIRCWVRNGATNEVSYNDFDFGYWEFVGLEIRQGTNWVNLPRSASGIHCGGCHAAGRIKRLGHKQVITGTDWQRYETGWRTTTYAASYEGTFALDLTAFQGPPRATSLPVEARVRQTFYSATPEAKKAVLYSPVFTLDGAAIQSLAFRDDPGLLHPVSTAPPPQAEAGGRYEAYWLTNQAHGSYVNLVLTRRLLMDLPVLVPPTNQPLLDCPALIVTTYARDSIWNVDRQPFKPLTGVEWAGTNVIVIKGERFSCTPAGLGDVLRLLRNPMGKIPIHRIHAALAGQEELAQGLASRIERQLSGVQAGKDPPVASSQNPNTAASLRDALTKIERRVPELVCVGATNGASSSAVWWHGEEYATADFVLRKNPRYHPPGEFPRATAPVPFMDLHAEIARYASARGAQRDLEESLHQRPAVTPPKEDYQGAVLYRYTSGWGNAICQVGQYVIEIEPNSDGARPLTMKVVDVVLGELGSSSLGPK